MVFNASTDATRISLWQIATKENSNNTQKPTPVKILFLTEFAINFYLPV